MKEASWALLQKPGAEVEKEQLLMPLLWLHRSEAATAPFTSHLAALASRCLLFE